ncbi:MAG: peroxiredoxin [Acidimicrobiales bacterium]
MQPGDQAPQFELPDQNGEMRSLADLLAKGPVALFFYPAAMTPGCTKESCHFRDLAAEFAEAGVQRVGISPDAVDKQKLFDTTHSLGFPLLSDKSGDVARAYGVRRSMGPLATKRTTFAISPDGTVVNVVRSELRMSVHADGALTALSAPAGA